MSSIESQLRSASEAQGAWAAKPLRQRLAILKQARHAIAEHSRELVNALGDRPGRTRAESLNAEVLPLMDGLKFLQKNAAKILAAQYLNNKGRPTWLMGHHATVTREPLGIVLIIGPGNYPLFLPGVQAAQALAAGNAVVIKPGTHGQGAALGLQKFLINAGLDPRLLVVLDESVESAKSAWAVMGSNGTPLIKKVVLTGSAKSGASILSELAPKLIPVTMELSGCDAAVVLEGANLELTANALVWGLRLNSGCTCIAPRRILVHQSLAKDFEKALLLRIKDASPMPVAVPTLQKIKPWIDAALATGARMLNPVEVNPESGALKTLILIDAKPEMEVARADIFAPVSSLITFKDEKEALEIYEQSPYALGASVFGPSGAASRLAQDLRAGSVAINDLIAPTADPRVSFGGVDLSGFGSTRGPEGLLEMTYPKIVTRREGTFRPHYDPSKPEDEALFTEYIKAAHGEKTTGRLRSWMKVLGALRKRK